MATVYTTHQMTETAMESSTYIVPIAAFYDEDGTAVTPATLAWGLRDGNDKTINSREDVAATAATSYDIILSGADLAVTDNTNLARCVTVEYTYDSDAGSGLPGKQAIWFNIQPSNSI